MYEMTIGGDVTVEIMKSGYKGLNHLRELIRNHERFNQLPADYKADDIEIYVLYGLMRSTWEDENGNEFNFRIESNECYGDLEAMDGYVRRLPIYSALSS